MFFFSCVTIILESCFLVNVCASPGLPHCRPPPPCHVFSMAGSGSKTGISATQRQPGGAAAACSALKKHNHLVPYECLRGSGRPSKQPPRVPGGKLPWETAEVPVLHPQIPHPTAMVTDALSSVPSEQLRHHSILGGP